MGLSLNVISYQGHPPVEPLGVSFDEKGGSIGRKQDNNWVLTDPEHYISGHHAQIKYSEPDYFIVDTSSNGVYINNAEQPLGKGNSVQLADGDVIGIGEYDISVSLDSTPSFFKEPSPNHEMNDRSFAEFDDDPFAGLGKNPVDEALVDAESLSDDWMSGESDPFAKGLSQPTDSLSGSQPDHTPLVNQSFDAIAPTGKPKEEPPQAMGTPFPEDWLESEDETESNQSPELNDPFAQPAPPVAVPQQKAEAPARSAAKVPAPAPLRKEPDTGASDSSAAHKFLRGAGLDDDAIADTMTPDTFYIIGKILRTTVQGTMDVLLARAKIKSEMRLDVTTIRAGKNNPIKFSFNVDEALSRLLT
ncbi:MAG TPA: type VI secretion system-associated FHA domain protein TagH, partial [Gammaproteobacteria bacterium]|nr:type VI secretion system-associated FHA domain protein TagH [Gammaproteobacteria bacterium]